MRLAIISDIHANARALRAALRAARQSAADEIVILGDLHTYGVDIEAVQDLIWECVERDGAILILGNHDQLYLDIAAGKRDYLDQLPHWIQESATFTAARLDATSFAQLPWRTEYQLGPVYCAHANPFGYGDWTYLNFDAELVRAGLALKETAAELGIFGHNHRAGAYEIRDGVARRLQPLEIRPHGSLMVVNPGSTGQPRDRARESSLAVVTLTDAGWDVQIQGIEYDVAAHISDLRKADMTQPTLDKLASFFI